MAKKTPSSWLGSFLRSVESSAQARRALTRATPAQPDPLAGLLEVESGETASAGPPPGADPYYDFLHRGATFVVTASRTVAALRYSRREQKLLVRYKDRHRGFVSWYYHPVDPVLAEEATKGSAGGFVWAHLRERGTVHKHRVNAHPARTGEV